ncbi:NAD(P)/FAD-dependent oxidoreductase [Nocardia inohanensis]|uniref:NAD(P)/FAD-dependent oxidoreductase n=1 Tax=Nocardia inohanensis TaxID=209246 RepID=UPI00082C9519|nr:FAD-dependent oxidoreductase [Nocardia inohanensis]
MTGAHRIVILGAGYAGLAAARQAARAEGAKVTVVDARAEFVDRVRLHQALAGQQVRRTDLRKSLERKGIEFIQARVGRIDAAGRRIELAAVDAAPGTASHQPGWVLGYDTLVYALGSRGDRSAVPGAGEFAYSVATPEDLARVPELTGTVAVVGGGATGIEVAAELAESRPDLEVALVSADEPGGWLSAAARDHIRATFDRLGVRVHSDAKVESVTAAGLELAGGERIEAGIVLWCTGFAVPQVAIRSGLAVDAHGRVLVDDKLRSRSHPAVYAVGDCAVMAGPDGRALRMACATALPAGKYVGKSIVSRLRGREPRAHSYGYVLQCISLGRRDAVVQRVRADDSPTDRVFTGRPAVWIKEGIVRGVGGAARLSPLT